MHVARLAAAYGLDVKDDLATILPGTPDTAEADDYDDLFFFGRTPLGALD
ncbi:MAG: hypothetical protein AB1700_21250 [Bacillota bacterium]